MSFTFTVRYYRDIWDDEAEQRIAEYDVDSGEVIGLSNLVDHFALPSSTFASIWIGDIWVASYTRDIETLEWREAR